MSEDPLMEEESYTDLCRERSLEVVEHFRIFRAGRDFEKGSMKIFAPQARLLRAGLWRTYLNWRRIEERFALEWHIPVIADPDEMELGPRYYERAKKVDVEKWILDEEKSAKSRLLVARDHSEAMRSGLGTKSERRFANSTTLAFEKEVDMIIKAAAGKWEK